MRILVVEDEVKIRKGIANLINRHTKHTVIGEAKNGVEGYEMALRHQPEVVITDIRMPEMDGLEMMQKLQEKGGPWHFVILSGYSEFEYAKQALRCGAEDYLLKPLAPEDVTGLLSSIQEKIEAESRKTRGMPEKKLRDYLIENDLGSPEELAAACGCQEDGAFRLVCAYTGNAGQEDREVCLDRFQKLKQMFPEQKIYFFFTESTREFICFLEDKNWNEILKELEGKLLGRKLSGGSWAWTTDRAEGLTKLKEVYEDLKTRYAYGLVLGYGTFLTKERTEAFAPAAWQYPKIEESRLQKAFYKEDRDDFKKAADRFLQELSMARILPGQIRESCMKMVNFLTGMAQEHNRGIYEQLQNLHVVRQIGRAVTFQELTDIFSEVVDAFLQHMGQCEDISNYTIKRTIDYIRMHYQESISLEGVAARLDITPEYLSTLFNREMGENFTVFLKKFRISHAKRLLKGTDKKIYEIAQDVGYADPKYFNRVFKEEEGVSPGDYRSLQH